MLGFFCMGGLLKKHVLSHAEGSTSGVLWPLVSFALTDLPLFAAFVLTYTVYAPRVKRAPALPVEKGVLAPLGLGG